MKKLTNDTMKNMKKMKNTKKQINHMKNEVLMTMQVKHMEENLWVQ